MSRPRSGVVEVFAGTTGLTDIEQGSGVLVAPDEVLTAAHVVDGAGGIRSDIDVVTGTGIGTSPPSSDYASATVHVAPGFVPSPDGVESGTVTAHDFALIHLSRPVSGTVYALGSSDGGTLTVGGYPAGLGSAYDEATETFTSYSPLAQAGVGPGTFEAKPLGEGTDPHGSSGGPVIDPNAGTPTVVGIVQGTDTSDRMGDFVQLTDADIAEIQGWIAADHG